MRKKRTSSRLLDKLGTFFSTGTVGPFLYNPPENELNCLTRMKEFYNLGVLLQVSTQLLDRLALSCFPSRSD